jgi:hypothetical protein
MKIGGMAGGEKLKLFLLQCNQANCLLLFHIMVCLSSCGRRKHPANRLENSLISSFAVVMGIICWHILLCC